MADSPVTILERLLAQPAYFQNMHRLRESRSFWDDDWTYEEMDALAHQFAADYRALVAEVRAVWGPPDFSGDFDTPGFPGWCLASELTYWRKGNRLACVWWEHCDKEDPFALVLHAAADTETGCTTE